MEEDYYEVLGVARDASDDVIQKAYRDLARKFHPDMNPDDRSAKEKFQRVQRAYDVLGDADKRKKYDRFGSQFEQYEAAGGRPFQAEDLEQHFGGFGSLDDFVRQFAGGGAGGPRGRGRGRRQRPADARQKIMIPFNTAVNGGSIDVQVQQGTETKSVSVKIKPGIAEGETLRLRNLGSQIGGQSGDLLLEIGVRAHPHFTRDGLDLKIDVPITITEAIQGGSVDVPSPRGDLSIKVPPGTNSGKRLRLKGQGIQTRTDSGDLYATLLIVLPDTLDDEVRASAEQLSGKYQQPVRKDLNW